MLAVRQAIFVEIAADAEAQVLGLADVDHSVRVLIEVHAGIERKQSGFFTEVHCCRGSDGGSYSLLWHAMTKRISAVTARPLFWSSATRCVRAAGRASVSTE